MVTGSWGRVSVPPEHWGRVVPPSSLRQHPRSALGRTQLLQTRVPLRTPTLCVRSVQEFMTFTSQLIVERSALGSRASVKEQGERITRGSARAASRKAGGAELGQGPPRRGGYRRNRDLPGCCLRASLLSSGHLELSGCAPAALRLPGLPWPMQQLRSKGQPRRRSLLSLRLCPAIPGSVPPSLASPHTSPPGSAFQALGRAGCGLELAAAASLMTTLRPVMSCYLL